MGARQRSRPPGYKLSGEREYKAQESLRSAVAERDARSSTASGNRTKWESMGRIVGGVAHDFNSILGTMLASVDFLLDELPGEQHAAR